MLRRSCRLERFARESKRPCAPWSPGTGCHRLSRRPGGSASSLSCPSTARAPSSRSNRPGTTFDPTHEMLTVMSALRAYEANLAALQATRSLAARALDIGGHA